MSHRGHHAHGDAHAPPPHRMPPHPVTSQHLEAWKRRGRGQGAAPKVFSIQPRQPNASPNSDSKPASQPSTTNSARPPAVRARVRAAKSSAFARKC